MIADVVFDIPLARAFSYQVSPSQSVVVGQRVRAPLHGRVRVGVVVGCREGEGEGLRALTGPVEPAPLLGPLGLHLARWISGESYSSPGSTLIALLPPVPRRVGLADFKGISFGTARGRKPPSEAPPLPLLLVGGDREERLLALLKDRARDQALVLVSEIEAAGTWARRLESGLGERVARLDSGSSALDRWRAWLELTRGSLRVAVGTRSALLAPLPAPGILVLLDEHDPAHKPPGHPRIHAREVLFQRGLLEGHSVILASGTPSVESWWQADSGRLIRGEGSPAPWPEVDVVDARGGLRKSPLSTELHRAIRKTLDRGGQVCLLVTRVSSVLACGECGFLLRCRDCEITLAYSRARRECACRLCGGREPAPDTCPRCSGRQLAPAGWGAERVEQVVRQAFARLRLARYDNKALTDAAARRLTQEWQEGAVRLVIATRQALKALPPGDVQLVGAVNPDHLLRLPDFRAAERTFALLWAAAEWIGTRGRLIVQTQHPEHYAIRAAAAQELGGFYKPELKFRAEAGYPPFRRLSVVTVRGRDAARARSLSEECWKELDRLRGVTVFPPVPYGRSARALRWRIVVKGGSDLPGLLRPGLAPFLERRGPAPGMVEVEVDPVELI